MEDEDAILVAKCDICGTLVENPEEMTVYTTIVCSDCVDRYPLTLIMAVTRESVYAIKITTGDVIEFVSATIMGEFVSLLGVINAEHLSYSFANGLDVRISQIVWCANTVAEESSDGEK